MERATRVFESCLAWTTLLHVPLKPPKPSKPARLTSVSEWFGHSRDRTAMDSWDPLADPADSGVETSCTRDVKPAPGRGLSGVIFLWQLVSTTALCQPKVTAQQWTMLRYWQSQVLWGVRQLCSGMQTTAAEQNQVCLSSPRLPVGRPILDSHARSRGVDMAGGGPWSLRSTERAH